MLPSASAAPAPFRRGPDERLAVRLGTTTPHRTLISVKTQGYMLIMGNSTRTFHTYDGARIDATSRRFNGARGNPEPA